MRRNSLLICIAVVSLCATPLPSAYSVPIWYCAAGMPVSARGSQDSMAFA